MGEKKALLFLDAVQMSSIVDAEPFITFFFLKLIKLVMIDVIIGWYC